MEDQFDDDAISTTKKKSKGKKKNLWYENGVYLIGKEKVGGKGKQKCNTVFF
jgi:hypothetical protein